MQIFLPINGMCPKDSTCDQLEPRNFLFGVCPLRYTESCQKGRGGKICLEVIPDRCARGGWFIEDLAAVV